ncbi:MULTISPECIES: DUF1350 family protein [unclassified Tolypothrix]|uniref:DUF1350 family protein n=1 Tax=unclassified Tolypothrix TaxID=2649714 RepID=UPI0005F77254|nr:MULTISPECIES: DUF1350 family protein [unclassified Tolypothrix]MBE9087755.1 DUF1350 family protein [Tolypothrix sp. LEGE 11397]UYD24933.1 DUF1350 family protein [Tolypothrix sp. PCC 7712]UYD32834.1 DUF1350 family protein [Tolypothrix sp. PCC 7601]BAY90801.1 hypothetical protein NIES3275_28180 [Microchaete diplosiphon NIES-3275]
MLPNFKFIPISFSWVAIHPETKGVIQFIGGAFFGTFPTIFYRYFLQTLYAEGYTIIAIPFRFSFRHWPIAIDLLKEQDRISKELAKITGDESYQKKDNYLWIGHSLGCKYIALLEFMSGQQWQQIIESCVEKKAVQQIETIIANADLENASILSQPSLLIAPDISNTESAIPIRAIAQFLDKLGLGVLPTREQTQCFIERSLLFNLTALISFNRDNLAGSITDEFKDKQTRENSDVLWLLQQLKTRKFSLLHQELAGKHLEPLGVRVGKYIVDFNPFDKFIALLSRRLLEKYVLQFIIQLKQRQT